MYNTLKAALSTFYVILPGYALSLFYSFQGLHGANNKATAAKSMFAHCINEGQNVNFQKYAN